MRLIFSIFFLFGLLSCESRSSSSDLNVLVEYLQSNIEQNKFDIRFYNPPLPPELKHNRTQKKHDSIIAKLMPLKLYIADSVTYENNLSYDHVDSIIDSIFLNKTLVYKSKHFPLPLSISNDYEKINLKSIGRLKFFNIYPDIKLNDDYGGLIYFKNLYMSKDGKKSYFEVNYFKHELNSASYIVYGQYVNNAWVFKSKLMTIS